MSDRAPAPEGRITRGTTGPNRLRRSDRWTAHHPDVARTLSGASPLAVDVGYGARPDTTLEWAGWLRRISPGVHVVGLEIDPDRVVPGRGGVEFARGGFELAGLRPNLIRAFNVLRQYDEDEVADAWATMLAGLRPGGRLIEGTCDELGRRCCWVLLGPSGPISLTLAWAPGFTDRPSELAERLPKALIHRNVSGERIHTLLQQADECWDHAAGYAPYGNRLRWRAAAAMLAEHTGIPATHPRRDSVLTVPWRLVAP
ncbi:class I SAM-dependent methyltransferase [Tsukamurella sp. 8F]|uniref:class I SAM-dependent methyltransferase n=1 Tax=unclassified Tsukamurella TaxID=2633480 RepID=UPI0023B9AD3E|nr:MULTISPECIES: class I SAM-dependent methyltransferase [unclassified Tsukamurella]MDF0528318.1 class I SAM-dependent methyltransferase [Tsukamurella sp. 8J]MDF0586143.1 class I SAM-dependent methyltransferase [Tsukamurella sp. 8F]